MSVNAFDFANHLDLIDLYSPGLGGVGGRELNWTIKRKEGVGGIGLQATEYKSWEREEGGGQSRPNKCKFSKQSHGREEGGGGE